MSNTFKCILKPVDRTCDEITLDKIHDKVFLGRGPLTNIKDKRCSRLQVQIELNVHTESLKLKQLGSNYSGINGTPLVINEERILSNEDIVEVLHNEYKYKVEFIGGTNKNSTPECVSILKGVQTNTSTSSNSEEDNENSVSSMKESKESVEEEKDLIDSDTEHECNKRSIDKVDTTDIEETMDKRVKIDESKGGEWEEIDNGKLLVFSSKNVKHSEKIAAFDLDGTIITTKSGKVFPVNLEDWKLLFNNVVTSILKCFQDGYKIVIFTNQANIGRKKMSSKDFQKKAEKIIRTLNVPLQMFVATSNDKYRKPVTGMWEYLCKKKNGNIAIDMKDSFYVGDAAGRPANWAPKKKKDFACTDYLFAFNLNLKFHTPEEFFLKEKSVEFSNLPKFNPRDVYQTSINKPIPNIKHNRKQVLIMIGSQGSGKSNFVSSYLKPLKYIIVNRDTLGSWQKCISVMKAALDSGLSVVVDNTNPDKESRKKFLDEAKKHGVSCKAIYMNIDKEHAKHNIKFRELTDPSHVPIPDIIINSYFTKFQLPTVEEGFDEIINVDFISKKFSNSEHEKLYQMYLLEK